MPGLQLLALSPSRTMPWLESLRRLLAGLGIPIRRPGKNATGLVAAIVVIDREDLSMPCIGVGDEEAVVDQLRLAVERGALGKFDGADWSAEKIQWFFFGEDAGRLEAGAHGCASPATASPVPGAKLASDFARETARPSVSMHVVRVRHVGMRML
jgi:hypothetical protein